MCVPVWSCIVDLARCPWDLVVDAGVMYVCDLANERIMRSAMCVATIPETEIRRETPIFAFQNHHTVLKKVLETNAACRNLLDCGARAEKGALGEPSRY